MSRTRDKHQTRDQSHSLRTYSFLLTIVLLAMIIGGSYYNSLPKVGHIPDTFHFQSTSWMTFVPQTAQYVAYVDYQQAYSASGNTFLFGTSPVFQFFQIPINIPPQSVLYDLDIQVPVAGVSSSVVTVSVIELRNDTMRIFTSELAKVEIPSSAYDGFPVYSLLIVNPVASQQQKLLTGYVAVVEDVLIVSIDPKYGKSGVETILDEYTSNAPNLFANTDVRRGVYASGAADVAYIGLFVGTFSSQFNNTRMIVKSIVSNGGGISVTRSILFPTSDFAMSEFGHAHNVYRDANSYIVLDQWLVISYSYTFDKLRGELTGI